MPSISVTCESPALRSKASRDAYEKDLLEPDAWREYVSSVEGFGLHAKLDAWQNNASRVYELDLSPLSSEARERLKTDLRAIIEQLIKEQEKGREAHKAVVAVIKDERVDVGKDLKR